MCFKFNWPFKFYFLWITCFYHLFFLLMCYFQKWTKGKWYVNMKTFILYYLDFWGCDDKLHPKHFVYYQNKYHKERSSFSHVHKNNDQGDIRKYWVSPKHKTCCDYIVNLVNISTVNITTHHILTEILMGGRI